MPSSCETRCSLGETREGMYVVNSLTLPVCVCICMYVFLQASQIVQLEMAPTGKRNTWHTKDN